MIKKQITEDMKQAMRDKDIVARDALRMLDSMIKNEEIAQHSREEGLTDAQVIAIVKRAIKQRKDSAQQFRDGGRDEAAEKEESEARLFEQYLPEQMSDDAVREIVEEAVVTVGAKTSADLGKVMGAVMQKIGQDADGSLVRTIAMEILDQNES